MNEALQFILAGMLAILLVPMVPGTRFSERHATGRIDVRRR